MLTKKEIALRLGVSQGTIDNYRKEGMPTETFGKSIRFDYEKCLDWLRNYKRK